MNKLIAVALVAATMFAGAFSAKYAFQASYKMTNNNTFANGYVFGTLYYRYDSDKLTDSRIRYDTSYPLDENTTITSTELYHYEKMAIYTICTECSARKLYGDPEQWWRIEGDNCQQTGNYLTCSRDSVNAQGVEQMVLKDGTPATEGFEIKTVKLADGTVLEFSSFSSINFDNAKFELPAQPVCPTEVVCSSYADIVFILDSSTSVNDTEWEQSKAFVEEVVRKFNPSAGGAYIGVVEFNSPSSSCGWNWMGTACPNSLKKETITLDNGKTESRYIDDCLWDTKCNNVTDSTAKILLNLTHENVINQVRGMSKSYGHTCQRYGLQLAYKMLFENNPRCVNGVCPTPVVIVVTDGEDLCHTSTAQWAEIVRNRMGDRGLLLEVGVGLESQFDRDYLKELSSKIAGYDATLNVGNYSAMETVLDELFTPVCELTQLGDTCGPNCHGFCACGKCACPKCSQGENVCIDYECDAANPLVGCVDGGNPCKDPVIEATKCYDQYCDENETDPSNKCKAVPKDCKAIVEQKTHKTYAKCIVFDCVNNTNGCSESNMRYDHDYCQSKIDDLCLIGRCDPTNYSQHPDSDGCIKVRMSCAGSEMTNYCNDVQCVNGKCIGSDCNKNPCVRINETTQQAEPLCEDRPCFETHCDDSDTFVGEDKDRCYYTSKCQPPSNPCKRLTCNNGECGEIADDVLNCSANNTACTTWRCDPDVGKCVSEPVVKEDTVCTHYECTDEEGWIAIPKCQTDNPCKVAKCLTGGVCYLEDVDCVEQLKITSLCEDGYCDEAEGGCKVTVIDGAYIDICGNCVSPYQRESVDAETMVDCIDAPEEELTKEGLAAAAIACIIIAAIILGAAIAASTILGTKALIDRARGAENQSVVSNPLFEESQTEMSNPAFVGDTV